MNNTIKNCKKCNINKDISEFNKDKSKNDGNKNICIACQKMYATKCYSNNKDFIIKKSLTYYEENKPNGMYKGEFNFGWDIDHIPSASSAINIKHLLQLNNFKNLQPLCSKINRDIKKDKINYGC